MPIITVQPRLIAFGIEVQIKPFTMGNPCPLSSIVSIIHPFGVGIQIFSLAVYDVVCRAHSHAHRELALEVMLTGNIDFSHFIVMRVAAQNLTGHSF